MNASGYLIQYPGLFVNSHSKHVVEVEFDNVEAANAYTPPFEGTEVTDNPDYYKRNYWKKTRLEK